MTGISRSVRINEIGAESISSMPSLPLVAVRTRLSLNSAPITAASDPRRLRLSSMIRIFVIAVIPFFVFPDRIAKSVLHDPFEIQFADRFIDILECAEAYRSKIGIKVPVCREHDH